MSYRMLCLVLPLAAWSGASAQPLSLDNVPAISLTTSSTLSAWAADVATGNVRARSAAGTLQNCGSQGSGGGTPPAVTLDNVTPISLTASTAVSAWSIDIATGNVVARSATGNIQNCSSGGGGTSPTITSFAPSSATVQPTGMITLSWSSANATSCAPFQGGNTDWSTLGTLPSTGSRQFEAPFDTGLVSFELRCTGGSQTVSATTHVNVQLPGGSCTPIYPAGDILLFQSLMLNPWPAYNGKNRLVIPNGRYMALEFTASNSPTQFGSITTTGYPGDGDGVGRASISTVPGCFDESQLGPNCLAPAQTFFGIGWSNGPTQYSCKLIPGVRYYLNMYYTECTHPGGQCGRDTGNIQQDVNPTQEY